MTFVFKAVCFSPTPLALCCSDFNLIWRISSKLNVLSHSITHIVQQQLEFDICRNVCVIG